jgi:hypothetical protein
MHQFYLYVLYTQTALNCVKTKYQQLRTYELIFYQNIKNLKQSNLDILSNCSSIPESSHQFLKKIKSLKPKEFNSFYSTRIHINSTPPHVNDYAQHGSQLAISFTPSITY